MTPTRNKRCARERFSKQWDDTSDKTVCTGDTRAYFNDKNVRGMQLPSFLITTSYNNSHHYKRTEPMVSNGSSPTESFKPPLTRKYTAKTVSLDIQVCRPQPPQGGPLKLIIKYPN